MPQNPDVPCAACGTLLWSGTTSLPPGERTCQPCRRARPKPPPPRVEPLAREVECPGCHQVFATTVMSKVHCSLNCKQRTKRRRRDASPPPTLPAPRRESRCADCGTRLTQPRPGTVATRCMPCRALRALELDRGMRRAKHGVVAAVAARESSWWRRLLGEWSR